MSEAIIELKNIRKHYGKHEVLKGVDMQINRGDIYGLIGRNGAGKTTIFEMILGLSEITDGTVSIAGSSTRSELFKNRGKIGFLVGSQMKSEIDRVLEIVGLQNVKKPYKTFSLGMGQRLGIAGAILGNPEILILDEPTNGLDPQGIADVRHMVQRFREEFNMTVVISSHILGELENTADRFGIINEGVVVKEITKADLAEKESAIEIAVDDLEKARKLLTEGGVKIMREVEERSTLEDYYFKLVGGGKE